MSRRSLSSLVAGLALVVAACSSSASSPGASAAAGTCSETKDAGAVAVSIKDFEFAPAAISAQVGQVIAFSNTGFEPHNATLDAGGCGTSTLQTGNTDGLIFTVAGTYPFHCTVHTQMHGTITVTG
jgi:plastocyanin